MSRVIVVANQKGGVGKTTTVANLGVALASDGLRVLLVDMDPQGALSATFGQDPYRLSVSVSHLLRDPDRPVDGVLCSPRRRLQLLPAGSGLLTDDVHLWRQPDRAHRLRRVLTPIRARWDFILIDTPPNLGILTANALTAADEVLIPVATEYLAMRGVRPLLDTIWGVRDRLQPDLRLLGVVPTLYEPRSPAAVQALQEIRRAFRRWVFSPIPRDDTAAVAPAARKTAVEYRPDSSVAQAYLRLAEEVKRHGGKLESAGRNQ